MQVTDAEAQTVLDELFGKGNSGGNESSTASTSHDSRMQPTTAATLQKAARTAKFAVGLDRSGPSGAGKARVEYEKVGGDFRSGGVIQVASLFMSVGRIFHLGK